ncbi:unnamed protein product [Linum tenue]|uniref:GST N-terminal domain-containing protein n=1 Tax=Linum tenue TaxID=586396 RepID=A0AAV0PL65_9ROSI|nr:unnamed protein product [Linum tenue]
MSTAASDKAAPEKLTPVYGPSSEQPPLFDGTTRLYISYRCPFAQRVLITRNFKGLQDEIKLVPFNLRSRPDWYAEKVYSENKVPSLEHNGKIMGESIDLMKYLDSNFEGPSLLPDDATKKQFAEELLEYTDTFNGNVYAAFKGDVVSDVDPVFDFLENSLSRFNDGPFFLGQFSLVDIAYIPFIERFQVFLSEVLKYDITEGRPKLAALIEVLNIIPSTTYEPITISYSSS